MKAANVRCASVRRFSPSGDVSSGRWKGRCPTNGNNSGRDLQGRAHYEADRRTLAEQCCAGKVVIREVTTWPSRASRASNSSSANELSVDSRTDELHRWPFSGERSAAKKSPLLIPAIARHRFSRVPVRFMGQDHASFCLLRRRARRLCPKDFEKRLGMQDVGRRVGDEYLPRDSSADFHVQRARRCRSREDRKCCRAACRVIV